MRFLSFKPVLLVLAFVFMTACSAPDINGAYVDDSNTRYTFSDGVVKFKLGGLLNMEARYVQDGKDVTIMVDGGQNLLYKVQGNGDLYSKDEDDLLKRVSSR